MIYKVGMLCKHFKGHNLLEKNIYRIIEIGVDGCDLDDCIEYTGDFDVMTAKNLVVYANIFQDNALFAREYEDISSELSIEKKEEYNQKVKVEPLTDDEISLVNSGEFIEKKRTAVAEKFNKKVKK